MTKQSKCCVYCGEPYGSKACRDYHDSEARRIQGELSSLDCSYAEDGIVRTVLRDRIEQERALS